MTSVPGGERCRHGAWSAVVCAAAGGGDAGTGLLLLVAPAATLALLGIAPPVDLAYVRFLGVFVGAVGVAYLYPWLLPRSGRDARVRIVLEVTALIRGAVAVFVAGSIALGTLPHAWLVVGGVDASLALGQAALLASGILDRVD